MFSRLCNNPIFFNLENIVMSISLWKSLMEAREEGREGGKKQNKNSLILSSTIHAHNFSSLVPLLHYFRAEITPSPHDSPPNV